MPLRDPAGWDELRFTCWHRHKGYLRGIPEQVDRWERSARLNPCKLIDCPERVRVQEEA